MASHNKTLRLTEGEREKYLSAVERELPSELIDRIVLGDSIELMKRIPPRSFDLIIADPPYNMRKNFAGEVFSRMDGEEYAEYTENWISLASELLKDGGTMYVCCDWRSGPSVYAALAKRLNVKNRITWQREKGRGSKSGWKSCHEDIYHAVKGEGSFHPERVMQRRRVLAPYTEGGEAKDWIETENGRFRDTYPSNFWDDITVPFWSMPENTEHPTQKPEKLIAKLILASSNEGDLVFDPFLGSGSTAAVARKLNRYYFGIEKSPEYAAVAACRAEKALTDKRIQGYDGVFYERNTKPVNK